MLAMTKKKNKTETATKDRRPGKKQIGLYVDEAIHDAFMSYVNNLEPRGVATGHLELAMREYLAKRGHWPPQGRE